jgi:hypothetical protein
MASLMLALILSLGGLLLVMIDPAFHAIGFVGLMSIVAGAALALLILYAYLRAYDEAQRWFRRQ